MGFSRQEYWSGLPLPSPQSNVEIIIIILSKPGKDTQDQLKSQKTTATMFVFPLVFFLKYLYIIYVVDLTDI